MPEICRFLGIVVRMFYNDHAPPHFHAAYGAEEAVVELESLAVIGGSLPPRVIGLVIEWAVLYRTELRSDWDRARRGEPLLPIEPLR